MLTRDQLTRHWQALLQPERFNDYGPNGLQVQGRNEIRTVVSGVTASLELIDAAIAHGADAIVVHHGLFWRNQNPCVVGWMQQRLKRLLAHDINLFAYHLPLDAHPELGNNAQLARQLGWMFAPEAVTRFGEQNLGWLVDVTPRSMADLVQGVEHGLQRQATVVDVGREVRRLAWCTGGAQAYFQAAIDAGADAFVTGEISEPQMHLARECGVSYIACGHHASERYGVAALGDALAAAFDVQHVFVELDNPA